VVLAIYYVKRRLTNSATFRLALIYMALFATSVMLLMYFIHWSTAGYMGRQLDATIQTEIAALADRYQKDGLGGLKQLIEKRVERQPPVPESFYLLTDPTFHFVSGNLDHWPQVEATPDGWIEFKLNQGKQTVRARRFILTDRFFHLLVGRNIHDLIRTQDIIATTLVWGLAITLILGTLGGALMSRVAGKRIEAINSTCRKIISGKFSERIPTKNSGDDFDQLADNLNSMLDQIENLMEGVRRVSDNIAHDLRTPLARLRNRLEEAKIPDINPTEREEIIEQALKETDHLLSTFNALLRIARIEADERRSGFALLDLAELINDVIELYSPLAEEKEQTIVTNIEPPLPLHGDRDLLFQAFANLLDNTIKYAPVGGQLQADAKKIDSEIVVTIADDGPGIPVESQEEVLQRFVRLDSSRSTPGSGLGLSLVAAVTKMHSGELQLKDNNPGLTIVLTLPYRSEETDS
jgi:signal transduction histidine kinase